MLNLKKNNDNLILSMTVRVLTADAHQGACQSCDILQLREKNKTQTQACYMNKNKCP